MLKVDVASCCAKEAYLALNSFSSLVGGGTFDPLLVSAQEFLKRSDCLEP